MYYSDEIIEEVRSKNDIVDVIGGYVSLRHKGNSFSCCCPFHHEKTPSFHVSREKQMYHCFGCGVGGNVYTFVMQYENFAFPEAIKMLADRCGMSLPEQELTEEQKKRENRKQILKEINRQAAAYFHYLLTKTEHGKTAMEYLHNRGYTDETITAFGMGYSDVYENDLYHYLKKKGYNDTQLRDAGLVEISEKYGAQDKFWNRVMVPILDINGKVIAFGGRVLGDAKPKYLNTKETDIFDKGHNLFAMHIARRSKKRGIIVCEGYMDVISMHQAGFDNAVASLGTALTYGQANMIKRYADEVYLAYDSDEAGTKANLKNVGILRDVGLITRVVNLKPYKDPDEFLKNEGVEAFAERIKDAVSGIMFEADTLADGYKLEDPEEKNQFAKKIAMRLATIEDAMERHNYIDAIAKKYQLDADSFKALVTKYGTMGINDATVEQQKVVTREQKKDKEKNFNEAQSLLLTWMVNDVKLFDTLKDYITEEDFVGEDYRSIANALFKQYRETGTVVPASLVDVTDDIERQQLVARILQTELPFDVDAEKRERAINDVIKKTKLERIDYELTMCGGDAKKCQELVIQKSKISKQYISIN